MLSAGRYEGVGSGKGLVPHRLDCGKRGRKLWGTSPPERVRSMNIPGRCLLIGSAQYKECSTCPICPEGHSKSTGEKWSELNFHDDWCKDWIEANPREAISDTKDS